MASTVSTRKVTVVPRDLKRDSSFGMTRIKTIKTPKLATYPKVFITKTPKYSFVAVPLDLLTRRLFYRTSLHSYCLPTSPYFVKRQVTESKLPRRFLAREQALPCALPAGREKKGELATTFPEFEFHLQLPCGSPSTVLSDFRQSARSGNERECKQTLKIKCQM